MPRHQSRYAGAAAVLEEAAPVSSHRTAVAVSPSLVVNVLATTWIAAMLLMGLFAPVRYRAMLQEDRGVEWATVWLFLFAAIADAWRAVRTRNVFVGLVALFCFFVAGEEFSWGQRLLGYYPPEFFLGHNVQQEMNLHNLPQATIQPGTILMILLGCYGILLPYASRNRLLVPLVKRLRLMPPPAYLTPWFAAAIVLMLWYPFTLTGEWIEAFAGALFLAAVIRSAPLLAGLVALSAVLGVGMTAATDTLERGRDAERVPCAASEVRSLVQDIGAGGAGAARLWRMSHLDRRVYNSVGQQYLQGDQLRRFSTTLCSGTASQHIDVRHKYDIDPWGSPYWVRVDKTAETERRLTVYSFGADRRWDPDGGGDDIAAAVTVRIR